MVIKLKRIYRGPKYTIGKMYVNGTFVCDTMEPPVFAKSHPAIPEGRYKVTPYPSAKFKGIRPLINDVPGRSAILIHEGNYPKDTQGCILVGKNDTVGVVCKSRLHLQSLMSYLNAAFACNELVEVFIG